MNPRDPDGAIPPTEGGRADGADDEGLRRTLAKALFVLNPIARAREILTLRRQIRELRADHRELERAVDGLYAEKERLSRMEQRADAAEARLRELQAALEEVRDTRMGRSETRLDELEAAVSSVGDVVREVRDERLPAVASRADALLDRLAEELEEIASLVERLLRREPLPVPAEAAAEDELAAALADVQPALIKAFRGGEKEISDRLERYLGAVRDAAPVLDLGCGRGEFLRLLTGAGVEALGVEGDPALAQGARRRGLRVAEADVLAALKEQPDAAWGSVTAFHLLEHLPPAELLSVLHEAYRVLRPGGTLIVECPNPHNLRVGASLYWLDPTHRRPLLPETLRVFLSTAGFRVGDPEYLHPFPEGQRFRATTQVSGPLRDDENELVRRLESLEGRLDGLLSGPRDFSLVAVKPATGEENQ